LKHEIEEQVRENRQKAEEIRRLERNIKDITQQLKGGDNKGGRPDQRRKEASANGGS
jgi:hypothetical protein